MVITLEKGVLKGIYKKSQLFPIFFKERVRDGVGIPAFAGMTVNVTTKQSFEEFILIKGFFGESYKNQKQLVY